MFSKAGDVFTKTRLMPVQVFWCLGVQVFRVNDILEGQKGDQGGVKPDVFKRAAQKWWKFNMV